MTLAASEIRCSYKVEQKHYVTSMMRRYSHYNPKQVIKSMRVHVELKTDEQQTPTTDLLVVHLQSLQLELIFLML